MKFVNDKGLNTPERLYAIGDMLKANFRWLVYNSEIPKPNFPYSISLLSAGDGKTYSFAEAEQVSIGQSVLWSVNEDIYLAIISSFDLEKEQITLGGVTRWQGEQGQTGENGKDPLLYTTVYSSSTKPTIGSPLVLSYIYFSRKPDVYEFFSGLIITWEDTSSSPSVTHSYECIAKVMVVNSPSTVLIQITGIVETTGQQGPQGEPGGINPDQIAALKQEILKSIYTIGAYYITESATSPALLLGFGIWTAVQGKFLIGQDVANGFDPGDEGGEATHTLTIEEMPQHQHDSIGGLSWSQELYAVDTLGNSSGGMGVKTNTDNTSATYRSKMETNIVGGSQPHNNMPPYRVVFIWRRTA